MAGSGGRSVSTKTGGGGVMPDRSMRGLGGRRDSALGRVVEDGADDAELPGRLGPTSVASGASSESDEDEELEDDDDEDVR